MARYTKDIMRKVHFINCDFCRYYVEVDTWYLNSAAINMCSLCGKDTCISCTGEACEDGVLCKECAVNHDFHYGEGVGIVNKETGKDVDWHKVKFRKSMIAGREPWNANKKES